MKKCINGVDAGPQGRVRDPHGIFDGLTDKQKKILRQILKLLKELGVPKKVFQTGLLTDIADQEGKKLIRYIFTGSFLLKKDDIVFYSPLKPSNIFKVVITSKKMPVTESNSDY